MSDMSLSYNQLFSMFSLNIFAYPMLGREEARMFISANSFTPRHHNTATHNGDVTQNRDTANKTPTRAQGCNVVHHKSLLNLV